MEVKLEMGDYGCPGSTSSGWCRVDVIFLFSQQWLVSVLCLKQLLIVLLCSFSGALSASFYESYQQAKINNAAKLRKIAMYRKYKIY